MLCQHCNQRDADYHFLIQTMGGGREVHLCAHCAQVLGRQYWSTFGGFPLRGDAGFAPTAAQGQVPDDMSEQFRRRRRLGELRAKLQRAVEAEDYETAATLRDEIKRAQRDGENTSSSSTGRKIPVN